MTDQKKPPAEGAPPMWPHSIADHQWGAGVGHEHTHDDGGDHDHDHDAPPGDGEEGLWMQDNVVLNTVGIDIGSAGTQVGFSRIHLQRISDQLSTRYIVVSREPLYHSPSILTPYRSETEIDAEALGSIIESSYALAGLSADEVDAGAVILTGEALRRDNAHAIADVLAEQGGEFVCATAGHHMECMLAVYGSGAARRSFDGERRILNIDIGGGTTKLGLVCKGELESTAAIHLGGRLLVVDDDDRIIRLDPAGREHARRAGFDWQLGSIARRADLTKVAATMADALVRVLNQQLTQDDVQRLLLTDPLQVPGTIDGVMFSGGVGEYVYDREQRDFGDLGKLFGWAIRERLAAGALPYPLLPAGECLRATVLGASEYSVQLSGNTTYISNSATLLPRKNLQVVPLGLELRDIIEPAEVARALQRALQRHDLVEGEQDIAISIRWSGTPRFQRLSALAQGLLQALPRTLAARRPLYVVTDGDIALSLGNLLKQDTLVESEVLVIDGITLWGFDFVDLGRIRVPSLTVPVTVKSLVFSEDPRAHGKGESDDWHHHGDGVMHKHHHHPHAHSHDHGHDHDHDHDHGHHHDHGHDHGHDGDKR